MCSERQREPHERDDILGSKLFSAIDGLPMFSLPIVTGDVNKRPVRVCIRSGAKVSILTANFLPDDVRTHAWASHEEIKVQNYSICPTRAATLANTLGTTSVRPENVVVTELPSAVDLILRSDWRRIAHMDITFQTNDVNSVPVEPGEKVSALKASPRKRSTSRRTGETLIALFCRQTNNRAFEEDGFVRLNTKCPAPGDGFKGPEDDAAQRCQKTPLRLIVQAPCHFAQAVLATNATKHRHGSDTQFRLMHAYNPKQPGERKIPSLEGYIDEYQRLHDLAREPIDTREKLQRIQRESVARYDEKRRASAFQTGDLVLLELSVPVALNARYEGPFQIASLTGQSTAEISTVPLISRKVNEVNSDDTHNVFWTPASCPRRTCRSP
ncbi:hypothetical protein MTO96_028784 [Rhipicephalus appendiculatus]